MKKIILTVLLFFIHAQATPQNNCVPGILHNNNNWLDVYSDIKRLSNDDFISGGSSLNFDSYHEQMFLIRTDACGNELWKQGYGDPTEYFNTVRMDYKQGDTFFVATALHYSNIIQWYTYSLTKFNMDGDILWMRKYWAGPKNSAPKSVVQTSDGGFAIVGFNQNFANDYSKIWFIKTDGEGNIEWDKYYGTDSNSEGVEQVMQLPDGGYLILGRRYYPGTSMRKIWLIRTDALGTILWERLHGNNFSTYGSHIIPVSDGYMISGIQYAAPTWQIAGDAYLLKTDVNGYLQWQRTYGGNYSEHLAKIMQLPDGNYMCMGSNTSWGTVGSPDGWLFKVSAVGDSIWSKTYRYNTLVVMPEYFYDFTTAPDGGFMICGWAGQPAPTNQDAWIVRTDSLGNACPPYNGCDWAVGVSSPPPNPLKGENSVYVYPNPAQNLLHLQNWQNMAAFNLYSLSGKVVCSQNPVTDSPITIAHIPAGLYIAEAQYTNGATLRQKLLIHR